MSVPESQFSITAQKPKKPRRARKFTTTHLPPGRARGWKSSRRAWRKGARTGRVIARGDRVFS